MHLRILCIFIEEYCCYGCLARLSLTFYHCNWANTLQGDAFGVATAPLLPEPFAAALHSNTNTHAAICVNACHMVVAPLCKLECLLTTVNANLRRSLRLLWNFSVPPH
jgi:hypothetical protein